MTKTSETPKPTPTLVSQISDRLRADIHSGVFKPGDRLPSEAALSREHSVSRTVVREAIADLRSDGLVETRKGAGAFALDPQQARKSQPFSDLDPARVSGVIELLEIRSAFEIRAAALAAARRSPTQLEAILKAHDAVAACVKAGENTREVDFEFHVAVAQATQNSRFPEFLMLIRDGIIPRAELGKSAAGRIQVTKNPHLVQEHGAIVAAIMDGDSAAAEAAMKLHLDGSLRRYREILRGSMTTPS